MSVAEYPDAARERSAPFPGYRPDRAAPTAAGKLSSNEAALGPAPAVLDAIAAVGGRAHRYPDAGSLRRLIAAEELVDEDRVIVTNGSDELCYLFVEPGAKVVLSNTPHGVYGVTLAVRERRRLEATLRELGVRYFPSQANFVTFRAPSPEALLGALFDAGLAVREGADLGLPGWLRVSVGAPPAMARLRAVLRELL